MKTLKTTLFCVLSSALSSPAIAAHDFGGETYGWWIPLVILIGLGLAKVLWDEGVRSLQRAIRNESLA